MRIHHPVVRITHWTNAVTMTVMIGSGWQIYNASPLFPFVFPTRLTLGGWLGDYEIARRVHFLAMAGIAVFIMVHRALIAIVPRTLRPMVTGRA
jgi:thiosulfate reductase cytochrome b subunit